MKVIHIESGLGNQMLSYCEYLALKQSNPAEPLFIENIIYEIPECNDVICQWNGYELGQVFGINAPNIRQQLSNSQWEKVIDSIKRSEFWLHNWNWPVYFQQAFAEVGLLLKNTRGNFEESGHSLVGLDINRKKTWRDYVRNTDIYSFLQMKKNWYEETRISRNYSNEKVHFYSSGIDELTGQRLSFKFINSGIERIENIIRETFVFPQINDERNKDIMSYIKGCNSVAIHARRGDMMGLNYPLYRFGYFRRCVNFIKRNVDSPEFFIFCDPNSVDWAYSNADILGLDFKKDKVQFVNWNSGSDSYRDMQLMANCKHQVITQSSFGWWGAWLNTYPDKITCSPSPLINTTHHF